LVARGDARGASILRDTERYPSHSPRLADALSQRLDDMLPNESRFCCGALLET
jgi:hypothetical protein